ncbi:hypothetical protein [Rhizobium indigoferae]|uniref:hypothetical protein n=1 Tax=Rhizobium indigoferae TaxID=158891 RepID=UPI00235C60C0|nr:hypothetical protein GCM10007919_21180 [Rhizobium indigoferae]
MVSDQANFAARQVGGVATALEKVGAELEASDQPEVGRYAKQIGRSVQGFATQMKDKDIGEIAAMAEEFGRKQPLAFLGIAALAGLTASRFLTATANTSNEANIPGYAQGAICSRRLHQWLNLRAFTCFQCASLLMFPKVNSAVGVLARQGRCG